MTKIHVSSMSSSINDMDTETDGRIDIQACGREWTLLSPANLESLWDAMTDEAFTEDERLPYWVELWPASIALAAWLESCKERISGKACLDLGCGLGLTALAAQAFGAHVIGVDYEKDALKYAARNATYNQIPSPLWVVMDWRHPAVKAKSCSFIWGGDIMYERRFVLPVLDFIDHALAPGGVMWVAEPNRTVYDLFRQSLETKGWSSRRVFQGQVPPLHVQKSMITVNLWEISRRV